VTLSELSIHEAAHALAYDSIGTPLEAVWLNLMLPDSDSHGQTMRALAEGERVIGMPLCQLYFVFMAGVAATMHLAGFSFEAKMNRFRSDFSMPVSVAVLNRVIGEDDVANELLFLRQLADGFCKDWVQEHRSPILRLAETLESVPKIDIPGGQRCELREAALQVAIASAWGPEKPSVDDTIAAADQWIDTHSPVEGDVPAWVKRFSELVNDRIAHARNHRFQKRNELCLCGSGKKYKKCHGSQF
jgi:SEC-C motif